jgi:hypothetical protein
MTIEAPPGALGLTHWGFVGAGTRFGIWARGR